MDQKPLLNFVSVLRSVPISNASYFADIETTIEGINSTEKRLRLLVAVWRIAWVRSEVSGNWRNLARRKLVRLFSKSDSVFKKIGIGVVEFTDDGLKDILEALVMLAKASIADYPECSPHWKSALQLIDCKKLNNPLRKKLDELEQTISELNQTCLRAVSEVSPSEQEIEGDLNSEQKDVMRRLIGAEGYRSAEELNQSPAAQEWNLLAAREPNLIPLESAIEAITNLLKDTEFSLRPHGKFTGRELVTHLSKKPLGGIRETQNKD